MTIATAEAIEPPAPPHRLRIALIVIGAIATLGAVRDLPGARFVTLPMLVFTLGVALFAIGVAIYGF